MTGGVLLLAAGFGRRFGADKRRHRLHDGTPLLLASLQRYAAAFPAVTVVLRPEDDELARWIAERYDPGRVRVVRCADAVLGMGHSLAAGASACADWDYLFVAFADMPWVEADTLATLRAALTEPADPHRIVVPVHDGADGHPVGFGAAHLPALARLEGDTGARSILQSGAGQVRRVNVDDAGVVRDVDRPEDAG